MEPSEQNAAVAADAEDHPGVLAPPPLIFLGPLLLGLVLDWALPLPTVHVHVAVRASVGGSLVLLGAAIAAWGLRTMRRARTPLDPRKTPRALVATGPFAYSRNPLYVALALVYAGIAVSLGAIFALALLGVVLLVLRQGVILREERYLERKFGDEYRSYKGRVRRWV